MKKFITKFLLLIFPIILLSYPIDWFISNNLKKSGRYSEGEYLVWNDIYNRKINAEVIVNGSSRAWRHISPELLEDNLNRTAYNIGIDGQGFPLQYFRYKELLKYNQKPNYILMSVDLFGFKKRKNLYNLEQFFPYMLHNEDIYNITKPYNGFSYWDFHIPLLRYTGNISTIIIAFKYFLKIEKAPPKRIKGYMGSEVKWNNDLKKAKAKMNYYELDIDSTLVSLFEQFIQESANNDTKLILVYTPEYIEGQRFVKNRDDIISIFEHFAEKYKLPFFDYSKDELCYDKKYFFNASHLNKLGSELFTQKLIKDLSKTNILHPKSKNEKR